VLCSLVSMAVRYYLEFILVACKMNMGEGEALSVAVCGLVKASSCRRHRAQAMHTYGSAAVAFCYSPPALHLALLSCLLSSTSHTAAASCLLRMALADRPEVSGCTQLAKAGYCAKLEW
jgi:hypothetical protein